MHQRSTIIGLVAALALAGCTIDPEPDAAPLETPSELAVPAVEPVPDTLPDVVARVTGIEIPRDDLERAIRAAETQAGQVVPPQFRDQVYRAVLDRLIDFHLLLHESMARELVVDDAEVDAELARIKSGFPSEAAFEQRPAEWQSSIEALREETRKDLLIAKTIEMEIVPSLGLDEAHVRTFYDQHQEQFSGTESIQASHILIGASPDADQAARDAARAHAETIRRQAAGAGADFAALAREHSTDEATAPNGGDLGFVERGQTVPPFETALFALDPGGVSDVVESPFGFHIIRAVERRAGSVVPYEEAGPQIRLLLIEQERQALMSEFLARLRAAGEVEILI